MHNYDDIINMPHHVSKKRKAMSLENRSAQFAPFSALKGYQEKINELAQMNDVINISKEKEEKTPKDKFK